jgi:hypothetical protein
MSDIVKKQSALCCADRAAVLALMVSRDRSLTSGWGFAGSQAVRLEM